MQVSVSETVPVALGVGGTSSGTIQSFPSISTEKCLPQMWGSQYRPGRLVLLEAATSHRVTSHRGRRCDGARALGEVRPAF